MITSRSIYEKRKSGDLDGAYKDALDLKESGSIDELGFNALAWCLYSLIDRDLKKENINSLRVKTYLMEYLKLPLEKKPSLVHSHILRLALKLAKENNSLNMLEFIRIWGIENFSEEDYESYKIPNGKEIPSLVERVILQASKDASETNNSDLHNYIYPHLEEAIKRFPKNIWLTWRKAKILVVMGKTDEAFILVSDFTKSKGDHYWVWEFLGDISDDCSLSCYCKAMLCNPDDDFSPKVRVKLAQLLSNIDEYSAAKYEIDKVITNKTKNGYKIPDDVNQMTSQKWYLTAKSVDSNLQFYKSNVEKAESLVFTNIPWVDANLGNTFEFKKIEGKPQRSLRNLYIKDSSSKYPKEVRVLNSKKFKSYEIGQALKIKGEFEKKSKFNLYLVDKRPDSLSWDLFEQKEFSDRLRVQNNMGFTKDNIFIPPPLITANNLQDGETWSGLALKMYDQKKKKLGWKAISINRRDI